MRQRETKRNLCRQRDAREREERDERGKIIARNVGSNRVYAFLSGATECEVGNVEWTVTRGGMGRLAEEVCAAPRDRGATRPFSSTKPRRPVRGAFKHLEQYIGTFLIIILRFVECFVVEAIPFCVCNFFSQQNTQIGSNSKLARDLQVAMCEEIGEPDLSTPFPAVGEHANLECSCNNHASKTCPFSRDQTRACIDSEQHSSIACCLLAHATPITSGYWRNPKFPGILRWISDFA